MSGHEPTLAELTIVAAAEAWRGDGEVLAAGIGVIPRLGASLAKLTFEPGLVMTDGEAFLVEQPVPLGARGAERPQPTGWLPYGRAFESVWSGRRHAMMMPAQIDRLGRTNISCLGSFQRPKLQMVGVRGFPGNTINHANSMFVPNHGHRSFVAEVDLVSGLGNTVSGLPAGVRNLGRLHLVVTNLCVLDFDGESGSARLRSLHPGVTFEEVQAATGFPLDRPAELPETPLPTAAQIEIIRRLDPLAMRATVFKGNPPARRPAALTQA